MLINVIDLRFVLEQKFHSLNLALLRGPHEWSLAATIGKVHEVNRTGRMA